MSVRERERVSERERGGGGEKGEGREIVCDVRC